MASEDAEVGWVLDGIVNLLRGPVWSVPILTFIEHKSVTFEPGPEEEEEEKTEEGEEEEDHRGLHQEYKALVDYLLQSFMDDLQVTPEQLEKACGMAAISTPFHRSLFEQVWAADDYNTFRTMMTQKNIELQLQALEMLQFKYGIMPESYKKEEEGQGEDDPVKKERELLEEVYRVSKEEHAVITQAMDKESRDLEEAIARSTQDDKVKLGQVIKVPKQQQEEEEEGQVEVKKEVKKEKKKEEHSKISVLPPISNRGSNIDPEDLRKRQEYLKAQRDKLLHMKQREREKQLHDFEEKDCKRPQSAKAARKALHGSQLDPKTLAVRRALAQRLKAEVIRDV